LTLKQATQSQLILVKYRKGDIMTPKQYNRFCRLETKIWKKEKELAKRMAQVRRAEKEHNNRRM